MKNNKMYSYLALGMQFTSSILVPPLCFIYGGMYLKDRFGLSERIMGLGVLLSALSMLASLIAFARKAILISQKNSKTSEGETTSYELRKKGRN